MKKILPVFFCLLQFSFAQNYTANLIDYAGGPRCIRMSDVDKDGYNDVVVASFAANEIDWCRNNGSNGFYRVNIAYNYYGASGVYAVDLDKDGDTDLLSCAYTANMVTWWQNNGSQSFTRIDLDTAFTGATAVWPADVDHDGDLDVVASADLSGQVAIWYNDGSQHFSKMIAGSNLFGVTSIYPVDLDKDNDIDILATADSSNRTVWLKNNGGSFSSITVDSSIVAPQAVYAMDLDKDSDIDIVIIGMNELAWFKNNGTQQFAKQTLNAAYATGTSIYIDDVDDDGDQDIIGTSSNGSLTIWENDGYANFYEWTITSNLPGARFITTGDVDKDGVKDLVTVSSSTGYVYWWKQETLKHQLDNTVWATQTIYPGVQWMSGLFSSLYNSAQSINIIDVDLNTAPVDIVVDGVSSGFKKTSEFATDANAIAAVNGNFFNTSAGGSVNYITRNYAVINNGMNFFNTPRDEAAFAVSNKEAVSIATVPPGGDWTMATQQKFMLSCGPRLLLNGGIKSNSADVFNSTRNPRTFAGTTPAKHVLFFTVDGRANQAAGMTMLEQTKLANYFGCDNAFNLDGGGSSTMWVNGVAPTGVVNYPSDNHTFDHYGERSVANAIMILPNNINQLPLQICKGDSTLFDGHFLSQSGFYTDTLTSGNKFGQDSILVLNLRVGVNMPTIIANGSILASSVSGTNYYWFLNGNVLSVHDSSFIPSSGGDYRLIVERNGCFSDSSSVYSFAITGILKNYPTQVHIFPNPSNSSVIMNGLANFIDKTISIYNEKGEMVLHQTINSETMVIDCTMLVSGLYFLKTENLLQKMLIQH